MSGFGETSPHLTTVRRDILGKKCNTCNILLQSIIEFILAHLNQLSYSLIKTNKTMPYNPIIGNNASKMLHVSKMVDLFLNILFKEKEINGKDKKIVSEMISCVHFRLSWCIINNLLVHIIVKSIQIQLLNKCVSTSQIMASSSYSVIKNAWHDKLFVFF